MFIFSFVWTIWIARLDSASYSASNLANLTPSDEQTDIYNLYYFYLFFQLTENILF